MCYIYFFLKLLHFCKCNIRIVSSLWRIKLDLILSYLILCHLILCYDDIPYLVLPYPILFYFILFFFMSPYFIVSCLFFIIFKSTNVLIIPFYNLIIDSLQISFVLLFFLWSYFFFSTPKCRAGRVNPWPAEQLRTKADVQSGHTFEGRLRELARVTSLWPCKYQRQVTKHSKSRELCQMCFGRNLWQRRTYWIR